MKDQLRSAQQKGCDVKVDPGISRHPPDSLCAESYPHGRVWTVGILVRLLTCYVGK